MVANVGDREQDRDASCRPSLLHLPQIVGTQRQQEEGAKMRESASDWGLDDRH